jgi:Trk-type K+ transport system membrane component
LCLQERQTLGNTVNGASQILLGYRRLPNRKEQRVLFQTSLLTLFVGGCAGSTAGGIKVVRVGRNVLTAFFSMV